jgi:FMN phosphatase YigB (HAD superfamily)
VARIAIDIDSTLHDYWPLFQRVVLERHGLDLPYEEQRDWGTILLPRDDVVACIEETHSDENILGAEPYPGAIETVSEWHRQGHWIHITSHRRDYARTATSAWLDRIGMPYDDLHCSFDKVSRCVELGIHVLVDDSPVNLIKAKRAGIAGATLIHPWNEEVVAAGDAIGAENWDELRVKLRPVLA